MDHPFAIVPLRLIPMVTPTAVCVYAVLAEAANQDAQCWPSIETIAERIGKSMDAVRKSIRALESAGWVVVRGRVAADGRQTSNCYRVLRVPCKNARDPLAKMQGTTLAKMQGEPDPYEPDPYEPEKTPMSDSTISTEPEPLTLTLATTSPAVDEPQQVFDHWITATNRTPRTRFTKERRRKVTQALKAGYTVADLTAAINGCLASPHHQGHNDTGTVYDDLELICRNETQIEKMIGYGERTPIRKPSVYQESADIVDQVFAAREQQTLNEISR